MSIFTVAYPDGRIGKDARNRFIEKFSCVPDLDYRNRRQRIGKYNFMITKARDVPRAVELGCDLGLTGQDFLMEYGCPKLGIAYDFRVSKSRVISFRRKDADFKTKRLVTVYPRIAEAYLRNKLKNPEDWEIVKLSGETESWVALCMADIGIDVTESGDTIRLTGLVIQDVIMESSAIIIARKDNIKTVRSLYGN
ncbi:MAG TPA: ATP phosphoribosyltransferase [archaeon]|nr:ATP phosphoribosyltransferase [archaeon]